MCVRREHVKALLWLQLLTQRRRKVASFLLPLFLLSIGCIIICIFNLDPTFIRTTLDDYQYEESYSSSCEGLSERVNDYAESYIEAADGVVQVSINSASNEFKVKPTITIAETDWLKFFNQHICGLLDMGTAVRVRKPIYYILDERYVFSDIDTFSFSVLLFYAAVLAELYQDKLRDTDKLLWSLGVTPAEQMISWYISVMVQSALWSGLNLVQFIPQTSSIHTSLAFLWLLYTLVFFSTAILAFISSKFVRGTLTFIAAIVHIVLVWLFFYVWLHVLEIKLPTSYLVRLAMMLHPVTQAINLFRLTIAGEFIKLGLNFQTLDSFFEIEPDRFFGNGWETIAFMLASSMLSSALFLVDFRAIEKRVIKYLQIENTEITENDSSRYAHVEPMKTDKDPAVEVRSLTKIYPNKFRALSDLNLTIYPGELIGLLGKNGAGKSTTMNVIAGFHEASGGKVLVNGIDMSSSRRNEAIGTLSFCPQEDRFFYRLTVLEHLKFVCLLKGAKYNAADANQLLKHLGIDQKSGAKPRNISGGQKRRVCIAMAYVAQSPLIILDEPTSAVDAATRKTLWSFFQAKQRENPQQAVILCTHFMQEADVLSQRIAIISDGCLRAFGSSPYLKGLFGVGYTISYPQKHQFEVETEVLGSLDEANLKCICVNESSFQIPMEASSALGEILAKLEERQIEFGFQSATLENVFVVLSSSGRIGESQKPRISSMESNCNKGDHVKKDDDPPELTNHNDPAGTKVERREEVSWFLANLRFSFAVDFHRLFRKNWLFLLAFSLFFFLFPQFLLLFCHLNQVILASRNPLQSGNVTVDLFTIHDHPKIGVFGEAPEEKLEEVRKVLEPTGVEIDTNITESEFLDNYIANPIGFYDRYPFLITYDEIEESFDCVLNSNFQSSESLCKLMMVNVHNKETGNKLNISFKMFPQKREWVFSRHRNAAEDESEISQCKGTVYYYLMAAIYFCLLFHILRIESQRNEIGLFSYYMANGGHPLFSLFNRVVGLLIIVFSYFLAFVVVAQYMDYKFALTADQKLVPVLSVSNVAFFSMFSMSFACFAIFFGKLTNSVILQLFFTLILGVIYMLFFARRNFRNNVFASSDWFKYLIFPGYILPAGSFGLIYSYETRENDCEVIKCLCSQAAVYLVLVVLIESLTVRRGLNSISKMIGRRQNEEAMTSLKSNTAISVHEVSHNYFAMNFEFPFFRWEKRRGFKLSIVKLTRALKDMSIQVQKNKCYALLGVNGAGKSTLFEILTGGIRLQKGFVSVLNKSLTKQPLEILKDFGYCPQSDKIPDYLTGDTMLNLIGQLRGLSDDAIESQKQYMVKVMDVKSHMNKPISGCSGGTKRKLSTMVAFIGFPKIIILDESTTGMDPLTRKKFAHLIRTAKRHGSTVIISSHTMEECESAADSICIMTRGKKHCEGTAEELKAQYGKFYSVTIKVPEHSKEGGDNSSPVTNASASDCHLSEDAETAKKIRGSSETTTPRNVIEATQQNIDLKPPPPPYSVPESVSTLLTQQFAGAELQYSFSAGLFRHLFFNIPKQGTRLSELFLRLDAMKRQQLFAECIVNTASLEHIFMQIAMEDEYSSSEKHI